jgi:hypothetical protein
MRHVAAVVAVLSTVACAYGPTIASFEPATGPRGVTTTLIAASGEVREGELLEVRETGLLLAGEKAIYFIPYEALQSATFKGMRLKAGGRRAPSEEQRGTLRLVSRFPQGLSPPLLQQLLEAHGQSEPRQVR